MRIKLYVYLYVSLFALTQTQECAPLWCHSVVIPPQTSRGLLICLSLHALQDLRRSWLEWTRRPETFSCPSRPVRSVRPPSSCGPRTTNPSPTARGSPSLRRAERTFSGFIWDSYLFLLVGEQRFTDMNVFFPRIHSDRWLLWHSHRFCHL